MTIVSWFVSLCRNLLFRNRVERDLNEELESYTRLVEEEQKQRGLSAVDARRAALLDLEGADQVKERVRDVRAGVMLESAWRDVRFAGRLLARTPGFTVAAVLSLGLGIGANTAIFQLLNALSFRGLPVERPDELVEIRGVGEGRSGRQTGRNRQFSAPVWEQLRKHQRVFSEVFAFGDTRFNLAPRGEVRYVEGLWVSGSFFEALGVHPVAGRLFTRADDRPGCGYFGAVISHSLWQREFAGRLDVIGQVFNVGEERVPVIGVTPANFFGVEVGRRFDVALPICSSGFDRRDHYWLAVLGRLKRGGSLAEANAHLAAIGPGILRETVPPEYRPHMVEKYLKMGFEAHGASAGVSPLRSNYARPLWVLMAIAGMVLLIAATNLANLMLARATAREHEFSIRLAIGGSRRRIVRQVLAEGLLLAAIGASVGLLLAQWSARALVASIGTTMDPIYLDLTLDWHVLGLTTLVAAVSCVLFALAPALRAAGAPVTLALAGRGSAASGRHRLASALVAIQVGVSFILVFGAVLFARSFQNLATVEPGFRTRDILMAHVFYQDSGMSMERRAAFNGDLLARFRAIPGVVEAASASSPPLSGSFWDTEIKIDGKAGQFTNVNQVTPGYFRAMNTRLIAGRDFEDRDSLGAPRVAIVSETFARKLLADRPVLGRVVAMPNAPGKPDTSYEIVGLVADSKYHNIKQEFQPILFIAEAQDEAPRGTRRFAMYSTRAPSDLMADVARVVGGLDPNAGLRFDVFSTLINRSLFRERLIAALSTGFGLLAVVLATVGVFGVVSYGVSRRKGEIGVRMALGARRVQIVRMILGELMRVVGLGLVAGVAAALLISQYVASLLFGLEPNDALTLAAAAVVLIVSALAAALVPACYAARLSPTIALRAQ
jgi:putative ABC transport system permease protein